MTRLEIREVPQQELIDNNVFPDDETMLLKQFKLSMRSYAGFKDGRAVFYAGIVDYDKGKGEVWSKLIDYTYAPSSVQCIRDLLDYVMARYNYDLITASVDAESPEMHRWITWMGFVSIGESKVYMGKGVHVYKWRGCR